ncbi:MAG TPA: 4'-phosphopantetheinyl transferase superfamily protein [Burkholderiales bacterium]|nr:4'-phosphopantetheinyl transferase superfamily protein [Burkholderiales bacterium]
MWNLLLPPEVIVIEATESMWACPPTPAESHFVAKAVPARQREFQAGRAAARAALRELGVEGFDLLPGDRRQPIWPTGIVGSITHTAEYCAVAVGRKVQVLALGIDAEQCEPLSPDLMHLICSAAEERMLRDRAGDSTGIWAKALFSAKESFYKAYFPETQISLGFHDVEVELRPEQGTFRASLTRDELPALFGRRELSGRVALHDGFIGTALAIASNAARDVTSSH